MGNGMQVFASHDPATGELVHRSEGHFSGRIGQMMEYEWDQIGQLVRRTNLTHALDYEHFEYDTRNRLTHAWRSSTGLGTPGSSPGEWQKTQQLRYDISGNILCKSDVSPGIDCNTGTNYFYEGSGNAGPHAVTRVNTQAGNRSFQYDANGNVIQESSHGTEQRRMSYNPANLVRRVTTGNEWSEFHYGLDRQRSIRRDGSGTGNIDRRTHYIGNVEILRDGQGNLIEKRRYIAGVALMVIQAHGSTDTRYQHRDHLGSIIALSNEFGEIVAHMSFDAWGQRRGPYWDDTPWVQWTQAGPPSWAVAMLGHTSRGYTGHTHLDDHGIIHTRSSSLLLRFLHKCKPHNSALGANGRIYDPHLARFLQADPFVEDTATLNRYSYVHNNPLLYTDPSGYLSFKDIIKIAVVVVVSFTGQSRAARACYMEIFADVLGICRHVPAEVAEAA